MEEKKKRCEKIIKHKLPLPLSVVNVVPHHNNQTLIELIHVELRPKSVFPRFA